MDVKPRIEGRYDLVDGRLVFGVGMAGDDGHTRLIGALGVPMSSAWIERRRVQAHGVPSAKVRSATEAPRLVTERKVIRKNNKNVSFPSSAVE